MGMQADFQGAAMVTRAGQVRADLAGGLADVETGTECSAQTRFQLCSVSKQFAAVAVLLLAESGRLDLHEPVERWLPGGTGPWSRITLHHLLSHTAGLPHWLEAEGLDPAVPMGIGDRVARIQQAPLRTAPGERWHYSSLGFVLAAVIVARASGRPYPEFVLERILSPLELNSTVVGGPPTGATFARGYQRAQPVPPWDLDSMPGTGDIWSTVGDLTRFTAALHSGVLLGSDSLRVMRTPHAPVLPDDYDRPPLATDGYGYGMFTGTFSGQALYYHPGDNPGYLSFTGWFPNRAAAIAVLANDEDVSIEDLLRRLLPVALDVSG
jgi:CubicO group peptidase (beta-lactamase class C family)